MSKARTMGAGNAGASRYVALNGNNGGGSKKQGLPSSVGRKENYDRSYGTNRDVVFYMNQLGGIGKGRSMFSTNSDGVHNPIKPSETEPLFKNSVSANIVINIEGDFYDYFKTASNSEQINIMTDTLEFQITDITSDDIPDGYNQKQFLITIYGIDCNNDRVVVHVKKYNPYFYIKIPDLWDGLVTDKFLKDVCGLKPTDDGKQDKIFSDIVKCERETCNEFYGLQWDIKMNKPKRFYSRIYYKFMR
mgnify:CR=1 FL=1